MERHESEWHGDPYAMTSSFGPDDGHHHHHHHHHNHHPRSFSDEPNDSTGGSNANCDSDHSLPLSGQKRHFSHPNYADYGYVKLYVVGVPRTATEQDVSFPVDQIKIEIREVFGEYGNIIEVVLLKDKWTGGQQECCFVKYATIEQAEGAIGALHGHPFAEGMSPLQIKYAVGERERLGSFGTHFHKLYVGSLNRQAAKWDIEEIFSPFGVVQEIFLVRDEFKQSRGSAFVQFSCREMAIAAIHALHGIYVMQGCEQPLIVRFADPKKPRLGDSRHHTPYLSDPSGGHTTMSNEMQQMMKSSSPSGYSRTTTSSSNAAPAAHHHHHLVNSSIAEEEYPLIDCEWSEHVSPDGDLYYYNCVTCQSRWEKPEEYALYEQEFDDIEQQHEYSEPDALSSPEAIEAISEV